MVKQNKKYKNIKSFFSKNKKPIIIISIVVIILAITAGLLYYFLKKKSSSTPFYPPGPTPLKGKINGCWSSLVGCGANAFNLISLASALPQNYNETDHTGYDKFFSFINGSFNKDMSNNNNRYIISIGGSNASPDGWVNFLNIVSKDATNFYNSCRCRGIVGVDFDLEGTTSDMKPNIIKFCDNLKNIDSNFIIMFTILLGSTDTFNTLLNYEKYDYLSLMLYNGGMYKADGTGAGCDWDGWAELILSKGSAGCNTPLRGDKSQYITNANLTAIKPEKVLLGLIIDTTGDKLNAQIQSRANELITKYNAAGSMIWVIPGWANTNSLQELKKLGYNIDPNNCIVGQGCPPSKYPCTPGSDCVASNCGKQKFSVTDDKCAPCADGQVYWPCDSGLCEVKQPVDQTCIKYV
jgi:hypothetical protein